MKPLIALAVALSIPLTARAQPPERSANIPGTQEFTFGDELVQSQLPRPDDATSRVRRGHSGPSLLRIRPHFVPEMLRAVERL